MPQILIRSLPAPVKEGLRRRAREHGRSMEAEARQILTDIIIPPSESPVLVWLETSERLRDQHPGPPLELPPRDAPREVPPL